MNRRSAILNPALAAAVAALGHTQTLWIVDPGLPLPDGPRVIDLALRGGTPGFAEVFEVVAAELQIESAVLAEQSRGACPALVELVGARVGAGALEFVTHEQLKLRSRDAHTIVRTGETTPYANVCLVGGVTFG